MPLTIDHLRRYALARSLFKPTTLGRAIARLGFVQADPLRAPARAQDLILRHRVRDYRAGDLERRYPRLPIEEDFFVNYGFLGLRHHALMHPRTPRTQWPKSRWAHAHAVLAFVRERGLVHPREVDAQFRHGKVRNWFGGSSNASTELLDGMHYRGLLRVARRDAGTRVYAAREPWPEPDTPEECRARMDALVDLIVAAYAPLPAPSLRRLVGALRTAAPQWADDRSRALAHARSRLGHAQVQGIDWYWPAEDNPASRRWRVEAGTLRLLAPFDPVVWDRRRFEVFWGWNYRFEAYTPAAKRKMGHYALPLLWGEQVIGWCNLAVRSARLVADPGFVARRPSSAAFAQALDAELRRMSDFLGFDRLLFVAVPGHSRPRAMAGVSPAPTLLVSRRDGERSWCRRRGRACANGRETSQGTRTKRLVEMAVRRGTHPERDNECSRHVAFAAATYVGGEGGIRSLAAH